MMSAITEDKQDLQTYLDSFDTEVEDESGAYTLSPETVEALSSADDVAKRILENEGDGNKHLEAVDSANDDNGTIFIDQDGNYYFQSAKGIVAIQPVGGKHPKMSPSRSASKLKPSSYAKSTRTPKQQSLPSNSATKIKKETVESNDLNYVLIVENDANNAEQSDEVDDPDGQSEHAEADKQIYEFDENEVEMDDPDNKEYLTEVRLKPNRSTSANTAGDSNLYSCMHCSYTTSKKFLLSRHLKTHSDDRPFKCSVCERGFKTNASLLNHINVHLGNKPHACSHCDMRFTTSGELVRHERYRHTGIKPHKCSECDYSSVELSKLRRHIRCHTGERPYQCPHCTYASPDTFKLKRHMRTHTGEKPYECDICHARFTQSNSLKAHRLIHSVGDKPVFQCSLCPTTCGRKTDLRMHIQKLHNSDKPIKCKRCGKDLPNRYSYKVHVKTHEGEKCYRCKFCPYASVSQRHLESHMLIHTDEKPFVCQHCEMCFRQRQLLNRHINLYHNENYVPPTPREKNHSCPHCERAFTHKGNLMRHMELHDPQSNKEREKQKLRIGRLTRVQADGTISTVVADQLDSQEDSEEETCEEDVEKESSYDQEATTSRNDKKASRKIATKQSHKQTEQKEKTVEVDGAATNDSPQIKTVSIKKEADGTEFMAFEVNDGQDYMVVEVIQCEEDDEDEDANGIEEENDVSTVLEISTVNDTQITPKNCFGFKNEAEDENEEFADDADTKETIELLHIINEE